MYASTLSVKIRAQKMHFILQCGHHSSHRKYYLDKLYNISPIFVNLTEDNLFRYIMTVSEHDTCNQMYVRT